MLNDNSKRLHYVRRNVKDGDLKWHHYMQLQLNAKGVKEELPMNVSIISSDFFDEDNRPLFKSSIRNMVWHKGDTIGLSLVDMMHGIASQYISEATIWQDGNMAEIYSFMKPGDTLPEAKGELRAIGMRCTIRVYNRRVLRYETITTNGGTFDCVVIEEYKSERVPLYRRETRSLSWYTDGIGYVRHDTYDTKGNHLTREDLHEIIHNPNN